MQVKPDPPASHDVPSRVGVSHIQASGLRAAPPKRRAGWLVYVSTVTIIVVLCFETFLIYLLPQKIEAARLWSAEVSRQRSEELVDSLRVRCDTMLDETQDNLYRQTVSMVTDELTEVAIYLRRNAEHLSTAQLARLHGDLVFLESLLGRIEDKTIFPSPDAIDVDARINNLLQPQE